MVILGDKPPEDLSAIGTVLRVFKDGRLEFENSAARPG